MEIITAINDAIDYIEDHLESSLEVEDIAKAACSSRYHFQRTFHALTGFTVAEYIRNRRMTLAAQELMKGSSKIIDVALKYGYESPDAFTKAFQRLHGVTPLSMKKGNVRLKAFPKLLVQVTIGGERELIYRIVELEQFEVFGVEFVTSTVDDACYHEIPAFCDRIWEDGTHYRMNQILGYPRMHMLHGIHYDFKEDGSRRYMMGWEVEENDIPKEYCRLSIPNHTWVVFEEKGRMPDSNTIQEIWKRIYIEWFPTSGYEQVEGPCLEKYRWDDEEFITYTGEVWVPVRKKNTYLI
ncbi:MAG TPA: AraC family transcriptional regulator [Lachnospiraceae bacterium]|nr:AraC family transcriptional regulator [Lachnospiraceae bacterium]